MLSWICMLGLCIGTSSSLGAQRKKKSLSSKTLTWPIFSPAAQLSSQGAVPTKSSDTNVCMQWHKLDHRADVEENNTTSNTPHNVFSEQCTEVTSVTKCSS